MTKDEFIASLLETGAIKVDAAAGGDRRPVSWERLDELKVKARRRKPFVREEEV